MLHAEDRLHRPHRQADAAAHAPAPRPERASHGHTVAGPLSSVRARSRCQLLRLHRLPCRLCRPRRSSTRSCTVTRRQRPGPPPSAGAAQLSRVLGRRPLRLPKAHASSSTSLSRPRRPRMLDLRSHRRRARRLSPPPPPSLPRNQATNRPARAVQDRRYVFGACSPNEVISKTSSNNLFIETLLLILIYHMHLHAFNALCAPPSIPYIIPPPPPILF